MRIVISSVRLWVAVLLLGLATPGLAQSAGASETTSKPDWAAETPAVDMQGSAGVPLERPVSLILREERLEVALEAIDMQARLGLTYTRRVVPLDRRVTVRLDSVPAREALRRVLEGTDVEVAQTKSGQIVLVKKPRAMGEVQLQTGSVVGRVTDAETGNALAGAEVLLEGTRWRTATGADGRYRLAEVEAGSYALMVRRIGYKKRSQAITVVAEQEVTVDVTLEPVATRLDEIVTTVTGDQRLRELGHVVGRINADSLVKEAPVSSVTELLTGRVPGLQVYQSQGLVGGQVSLRVRGLNSVVLNSEPIVIVDGIRYTNSEGQALVPGGLFGAEPTNRLNDLNPNDIETIEVVKGPSAATLYGTDAANGVIVITTRRGRPGPAQWNAYGKATTTAIPRISYPDAYWGWGSATSGCSLLGVADGSCTQDSITTVPNPLNDPALTIFNSKPRWEYGANVSGGGEDLRYYFSGDFERATGPLQLPSGMADSLQRLRGVSELPEDQLDPNAFTKANLRTNVTALLGERAELRVNAGYNRTATRTLGMSFGSPYSSGAFQGTTPTDPYGTSTSPASAFARTSTERVDRFVATASGQWRAASWLSARATAGLDLSSSTRSSLARRGEDPSLFVNGAVSDDRTRQVASTAELGATATFRRGRLSSRTAVGAQYVRHLTDALSSRGIDLPPGGTSVGDAAVTASSQSYAETVTLGSYFEEVLGLNDRLFVTGALRVDGASAFGRDYDAAAYPKAGASWLVSEEPFLPRLPGLDELRLRYAFGVSGQQATPLMALPRYVAGGVLLDGAVTNSIELEGLGNPNLRPERVREHEFGFDAAALRSRLQLSLTWYRRRTADQIVIIDLPPGLGSIHTNLGLTTGRGFEAQVTARLIERGPVTWAVTAQHSSQTTTLVDLGGAAAQYTSGGGWVEGYPLGARFMQPMLGYTDANGDGIIQPSEVQFGDTAVYVGASTPPRSQTLTTSFGLFNQRLRLSALLERRSGFTQVDQLKQDQCRAGHCRAAVDPSTPLTEQAEVAGLGASPAGQSAAGFTFVEAGDFTRLREVAAALDLPTGLARALRLSSATLSVSARNLALWTSFSGPDPESAAVSGASGGAASGIPQGRSWTLRLDLGL